MKQKTKPGTGPLRSLEFGVSFLVPSPHMELLASCPGSRLSLWGGWAPPPSHSRDLRPLLQDDGICLSMEGGAAVSTPAALPYFVLLGLTLVAMTGLGSCYRPSAPITSPPRCLLAAPCRRPHVHVDALTFPLSPPTALLVYRVFRNETKRTTKVLHGLLHVFALVIALVGLVAVFDYHRKKGYADLYSLHSWCGILVFVLYFVQWLVGFSFFLFPGASFSLRSRYRPQHIFFGASIFLLSVGTALLGLKEALLFNLGGKYSAFEPEGVLANVLGLLLACFGGAVLYILTPADWKRPSQAEEQALSMDFKTLTEGDSPGSQ
uniref:Transmembrane ascorbate-dependent reductase CYB561 n=1 Tax=Nomascus leucogenys TaxID=61853 RepID=A0A2I3GQ04_NOMLE